MDYMLIFQIATNDLVPISYVLNYRQTLTTAYAMKFPTINNTTFQSSANISIEELIFP